MTIPQIDVTTAKQWLDNDEAILIDVREPTEYTAARIDGAILLPLGAITADDIPPTDKKILIHCKVGGRSQRACEQLVAVDPNLDVYNVAGGIVAWHEAGLPLVSDDA